MISHVSLSDRRQIFKQGMYLLLSVMLYSNTTMLSLQSCQQAGTSQRGGATRKGEQSSMGGNERKECCQRRWVEYIFSFPAPLISQFPFKDKVFELCLAEIEKRAPANGGDAPAAGKCVIMWCLISRFGRLTLSIAYSTPPYSTPLSLRHHPIYVRWRVCYIAPKKAPNVCRLFTFTFIASFQGRAYRCLDFTFFRTIASKMDCIIVSNTIAFRSRASLHHVHLVNYSLCPNSQRACESTHSIVAHSLVAHNTFCFILHSTFWRHVYASPGRHYCKMGMNGLNKTISMQYKATRMIICIIDKNSRQFHCTSFFFCS